MSKNNTAKRVIVSIIAIPAIVALTIYGRELFLFFILAVSAISFYEFSNFAKNKNASINLPAGMLSILAVILNIYYNFVEPTNLYLIITLFILITELFRNKDSALRNTSAAFLGIAYIGFLFGSLLSIRELDANVGSYYIRGAYLILSILISIWLCDSAAFFIGCRYGKHKLFPRVSPKKSWEGAIAGFSFAILGFVVMKIIFMKFIPLADAIIIGVLIGAFSQIGDLVESLFKRDAEIKDSSNLIPGHGGVLDRFDSLLFAAPIVYLYLSFAGF